MYVPSHTTDKKSFNAKLKILKNRKNSGRGPGAPKGREGKPEFFRFFKIFNFALNDFLIQLHRNSTLLNPYTTLGGQFSLPTLYIALKFDGLFIIGYLFEQLLLF